MSSKVNHHEFIKAFLNNQSRHHKEAMLALAKRAVACSGWQWLPGMKAVHPQHGGWLFDSKSQGRDLSETGLKRCQTLPMRRQPPSSFKSFVRFAVRLFMPNQKVTDGGFFGPHQTHQTRENVLRLLAAHISSAQPK